MSCLKHSKRNDEATLLSVYNIRRVSRKDNGGRPMALGPRDASEEAVHPALSYYLCSLISVTFDVGWFVGEAECLLISSILSVSHGLDERRSAGESGIYMVEHMS